MEDDKSQRVSNALPICWRLLFRMLPPKDLENNIEFCCALYPDLIDDILGQFETPSKRVFDTESEKDFLICEYNRDGDSYR